MMKVVIASDSFKGSLTSREVGEAAASGVVAALPEAQVEIVPVADGGEGTVDAVVDCLGGERVTVNVSGPLGNPVNATYGICGELAIIEMAEASGITLIEPARRNPWLTSSYGTGQLIRDALLRGCRRFIIGLGGSATNDAGTGMLRALGYRFFDADGRETGFCGGDVGKIIRIDSSGKMPELADVSFTVACDVTNPLIGVQGASHVFAPQKGADPQMVIRLDEGLQSFAQMVGGQFGSDFSAAPGAGAAGGLGFAFLAFLHGELKRGVDMVLDTIGFDRRIKGASLVITGEGRLDRQTLMGKTPYGVLRRCQAQGIPVVAIGGSIEPDALSLLTAAGFSAIRAVTPPEMPLSEALRPATAARNIAATLHRLVEEAAPGGIGIAW